MRLHFAPPLLSLSLLAFSMPLLSRPPGCQCHPLRLVTNEGVCERRPARCPRAAPPPSPLSRRAALQMGISRSSLTLRLRVRTCAAAAAVPPTDLPSRSRCRRRRLLPKSDPRSRRSVDLNLSDRVTGTTVLIARLLAGSTSAWPTSPRFISHSDTEGVTGMAWRGRAWINLALMYKVEMDNQATRPKSQILSKI